ncbi:hypothetical protein yc1106_06599 [Curvularia clavata]|uniref:F-box domain-containing protein n=1 Tax=Curvularia clavata TaxID=95742 RepID=A0A9Q8ZCR5_CURCL|nr:hypothetical protein yc1106_06599 [Curvularia clavata]
MSRHMSAKEYQQLGRTFYKRKEYTQAVMTFTKGISICSEPTVDLYDDRAAAYIKLERFGEAVKDGKEMIRLDATNVRGYYRVGQALEKMGKGEKALEIYKYGMKRFGPKDPQFKACAFAYTLFSIRFVDILQDLHDNLIRDLSPAACVDPFSVLPKELAETILEYLTFRQMVNCMRVSKGWHSYIAGLPRLWMHLDLRYGLKPPPRSFVNFAFERSGFRMSKLTLLEFEHMDVIKNLAKAGKGLVDIEIRSLPKKVTSESLVDIAKESPNLKKLVVRAALKEDTMVKILNARPELEHVGFHSIVESKHPISWPKMLSHLHTLSLGWRETRDASKIELHKLMRLTPSLRELNISDVNFQSVRQDWLGDESELPPLKTLNLEFVGSFVHLFIPTTVQHLVMDNALGGVLNDFPNDPRFVSSQLPDLTNLSVSGYTINAKKIKWLLDSYLDNGDTERLVNGKPLQHLSLRCTLDSDATLCHGPENILCQSPRIFTPALESLDLSTMPCTDDDVEQLLTFDTGLTGIDLSDTRITGASVKMLVDKLPKLRHLKVDNCTRISGRDAIDYAMRKGVFVSYKMPRQTGGRKVRYA